MPPRTMLATETATREQGEYALLDRSANIGISRHRSFPTIINHWWDIDIDDIFSKDADMDIPDNLTHETQEAKSRGYDSF